MKTKHMLLSFLLTIAFCAPALAQFKATPTLPSSDAIPNLRLSGKRNVLILIGDDIGVDRSRQYLGLTGNDKSDLPATPTIRKLRQSGIAFNNAWANPVCSPTRAGLLTGRHSFRTGVADFIPSAPDLPAAETTLPELIASANYVSGLFGKWHLGGGLTGPNSQGFNEHRGILTEAVSDYASWQKYINGVSYDADPSTLAIDPTTQYPTEAAVQDALDWIQMQTNNWLAIVAFNAPHTPLHTPTAACAGVASTASDFNMMVECMDQHIDWLLTELATIGELANTTVIFIGDNGTDRNSILGPFNSSPQPSTAWRK